MKTKNKFKNLIDITSGILNSLEGVKAQSKERIKSKISNSIKKFDLVTREEFNEIKAMVVKAREINEKLERKIKLLEKKIR